MKNLGDIFYEEKKIKLNELSVEELNDILKKIQEQKTESKKNIDVILNSLLKQNKKYIID